MKMLESCRFGLSPVSASRKTTSGCCGDIRSNSIAILRLSLHEPTNHLEPAAHIEFYAGARLLLLGILHRHLVYFIFISRLESIIYRISELRVLLAGSGASVGKSRLGNERLNQRHPHTEPLDPCTPGDEVFGGICQTTSGQFPTLFLYLSNPRGAGWLSNLISARHRAPFRRSAHTGDRKRCNSIAVPDRGGQEVISVSEKTAQNCLQADLPALCDQLSGSLSFLGAIPPDRAHF